MFIAVPDGHARRRTERPANIQDGVEVSPGRNAWCCARLNAGKVAENSDMGKRCGGRVLQTPFEDPRSISLDASRPHSRQQNATSSFTSLRPLNSAQRGSLEGSGEGGELELNLWHKAMQQHPAHLSGKHMQTHIMYKSAVYFTVIEMENKSIVPAVTFQTCKILPHIINS